MTATIQTLLLLIAVLVVVALVARRFNTAPSILLVIAGIGLALIPELPRIELAPDLVLFGILPPLIYSAGVAMSWREFRFNLRPITLRGEIGLQAKHSRMVIVGECLGAAKPILREGQAPPRLAWP